MNGNDGQSQRPPEFQEVIVKFKPGSPIEVADGRVAGRGRNLDGFNDLLGRFQKAVPRLSFPRLSRRLKAIRAYAAEHVQARPFHLDLFIRVRFTEHAEAFLASALQLRKDEGESSEIAYAILASRAAPPPAAALPSGVDHSSLQKYLDPAPGGIDARYAWKVPGGGGTGSGVQVCVCDESYFQAHEDLGTVTPIYPLPSGTGASADVVHGTASTGVIGAENNGKGVTGICFGSKVLFASHYSTSAYRSEDGGTEGAVDIASGEDPEGGPPVLNEGDVFLIEKVVFYEPEGDAGTATEFDVPAEFDPDLREALRQASLPPSEGGIGILFVAAAGNRDFRLSDAKAEPIAGGPDVAIWDTGDPAFTDEDSHALIVGSGQSGGSGAIVPRARHANSNYGDRVDCQGWGDGVVTCATQSEYRKDFSGTSSAAAMVAGAVACLQSAVKAAGNPPLNWQDTRDLFRDIGTPQAPEGAEAAAVLKRIGPLPDLRRLLCAVGICPDVYVRDNLADTGVEPYPGTVLSKSPDIILRNAVVPNPEAMFGVGTWDDDTLGQSALAGQDNFVYVRVANRGSAPDDNVLADLFSSKPAMFIHPVYWTPLGQVSIGDVGAGDHVVGGPLLWPAAEVPGSGHYCLIAAISSGSESIEIPGAFASTEDFLSFVRSHNNIGFRNVEVIDAPAGQEVAFLFYARGLPERDDAFRFEAHHRLPPGTSMWLETSANLWRLVGPEGSARLVPVTAPAPGKPLASNLGSAIVLKSIHLARKQEILLTIRVKTPPTASPGRYEISADQYLDNLHLGRITFVLRIPPPGSFA